MWTCYVEVKAKPPSISCQGKRHAKSKTDLASTPHANNHQFMSLDARRTNGMPLNTAGRNTWRAGSFHASSDLGYRWQGGDHKRETGATHHTWIAVDGKGSFTKKSGECDSNRQSQFDFRIQNACTHNRRFAVKARWRSWENRGTRLDTGMSCLQRLAKLHH